MYIGSRNRGLVLRAQAPSVNHAPNCTHSTHNHGEPNRKGAAGCGVRALRLPQGMERTRFQEQGFSHPVVWKA